MDKDATLAELEAEFKALAQTVAVASARRVVLDGLIRERKRKAAAQAKVRGLDPLEREALKSALSEP